MTKWTATCPECGQRWHCWEKRSPCKCPECIARLYNRPRSVWLETGIDTEPGTLTFEEEPE